jgi:hypothetical protein
MRIIVGVFVGIACILIVVVFHRWTGWDVAKVVGTVAAVFFGLVAASMLIPGPIGSIFPILVGALGEAWNWCFRFFRSRK